MTKKSIYLIGGAIATYLIWKNFIKEDSDSLISSTEGETTSNASGDLDRVSSTGKCVYEGEEADGSYSETHITPCNGKCLDTLIKQRACRSKINARTRNSNLGL